MSGPCPLLLCKHRSNTVVSPPGLGRVAQLHPGRACQAAEPKPALGVVGPDFASEEIEVQKGQEGFPTVGEKKNHETYPAKVT